MKIKTPKSAVIVKFNTKSGAKKFAYMMKKMLLAGDLPISLIKLINEYHYENEII